MTIRFLSITLLLFVAGCAPRHFISKQASGVTFSLDVPEATEVLFASSLDQFRLHPTKKNHGGAWVTDNYANRELHYFYIVDGSVYIPDCSYRENDDFGKTNCIYQP
jgi:hypothetical protein